MPSANMLEAAGSPNSSAVPPARTTPRCHARAGKVSSLLFVLLLLLSLSSSSQLSTPFSSVAAAATSAEGARSELDPRNVRQPHHPQPRTYDSHHYYAVELAPAETGLFQPLDVAVALGAELVERIGELEGHWLVRFPKAQMQAQNSAEGLVARTDEGLEIHGHGERRWIDYELHEDPVLKRWDGLKTRPELGKRAAAAAAIRSVERQEPRQRTKRNAIYSPWDTPHLYDRGHHAGADTPLMQRDHADFDPRAARLPWPRHIPAPEGASPDPRDDPDFLAYAPVAAQAGTPRFITRSRVVDRRHYSGEGGDEAASSCNSTLALAALTRRRPPLIPDSPTMRIADKFDIHDPIFAQQWHLANDKRIGFDLNISGVWEQGIFGRGVNVAMIDDGIDMYSDDLKDNFYAEGSYDFNNHVPLPEPRLPEDQHGTRCAGEIAAVKNDRCGVGVAYKARVSGLRILSGPISDVDEAAALNYDYQQNHVYSCSWGPPDDGRSMDAPKGLIAKAILNGVQNGRAGKGSIFVFAGGNGGGADDQCNFDGYTNSIYTMTIAAVNREGQHPYYSEMCSANIATSWSSGAGDHIHTTDVTRNGIQRCTTMHGGTSAAAPLVAGIAALALEARPELTWRDMQHVAVRSAQMINPTDKDWQQTQAGRHYNHKYGYGIIDAHAFIEEAKRHKLVKAQAWLESPKLDIEPTRTLIQQGGVESTFNVTKELLVQNNLETLEHITVRVWITHERRGDVQVELTSPHGTKSVLARPRRFDGAKTGFPGWGFMTLKHWDENPIGQWKIQVFDRSHPKQTGNFLAWSMMLWGASIDPSKAKQWTFPPGSKEAQIELPGYPSASSSVSASAKASVTTQHAKPTAHLPSDHGTAHGESHQDFTNGMVTDPTTQQPEKPKADTGYLANLRKNSGTWLFVAAGVVFIFAGSVVAFFVMRRKRSPGGGGAGGSARYEFVPEDEDVAMGSLERGGGAGGETRGSKRARTKELYDACGDVASEEEDDEQNQSGHHTSLARGIYHDDEEEEEGDTRFSIGGPGSAITPTSAVTAERYRDEPEGDRDPAIPSSSGNDDEKRRAEEDLLFDVGNEEGDDAGSGGSWQDAKSES
ncbi:hypothetical protein K437DRAFT_253388 [Tilletiaria anomala UBC 951]|uniref:P/Homo B domain-containing protein n=1 Tax=Tilletiaria anomala (strain ATCC 24038 / CBS 436.72 / UBC 951) TaxID=1037660 RepID=A0A066WPY2_TILAU|nr:uncharacterized protein K437DRAFT_253388 [Tilletiaria anomala UBC 951]KDN53064.1 hypothetical protein K437DRAFT_253388 [Tilletiaria anomala UBC 951]